MLNLFNYLTPLDNKRIKNYVATHAVTEGSYIGNELYLREWAKSKKRLFHLLNGKLIYKAPLSIDRNKEEIYKDIQSELIKSHFIDSMTDFFCYEDKLYSLSALSSMSEEDKKKVKRICSELDSMIRFSKNIYYTNRLGDTGAFAKMNSDYKFPKNSYGKSLTLSPQMKLMRALRKLGEYFNYFDKDKNQFEEELHQLELTHSRILNDKKIKGNFCISIHPLDFMTFSDNNSDWTSCMSWTKDGCYRLGTVEMMNSNNVVCCYIESTSKGFSFAKNEEQQELEEYQWNNKKWRQLFIVTNDIIVSGKAYPYQSKDITWSFLEILKDLAKENLGRTYSFGIEEYKDMKHIGSLYRMQANKDWIAFKNTTKHNIIFDTKHMYNDMFNDHHSTIYWCYRNKVKRNTIISYSGKAICARCGKVILNETGIDADYDNYEGAYNERYRASTFICDECSSEIRCTYCYQDSPKIKHYELSNGTIICEDCLDNKIRVCPTCGEMMYLEGDVIVASNIHLYVRTTGNRKFYKQDLLRDTSREPLYWDTSDHKESYPKQEELEGKLIELVMCEECAKKFLEEHEDVTELVPSKDYYSPRWGYIGGDHYYISEIYDENMPAQRKAELERYFKKNLEKVDVNSFKQI